MPNSISISPERRFRMPVLFNSYRDKIKARNTFPSTHMINLNARQTTGKPSYNWVRLLVSSGATWPENYLTSRKENSDGVVRFSVSRGTRASLTVSWEGRGVGRSVRPHGSIVAAWNWGNGARKDPVVPFCR